MGDCIILERMKFEEVYQKLNDEQREAVDCVDGPLLVIAGPGTGKTQLLSARVANILKETDTLAENVLCLTFTEAGARNMRERLNGFIGQDSYRVNISTYHGFGRELIATNRDYFEERMLERAVDEVTTHGIVARILEGLSYQDILRRADVFDVISTISELKRELVSAEMLREIVAQNREIAAEVNEVLQEAMSGVKRMPSGLEQARPIYEKVLEVLRENADQSGVGRFKNIAAEYLFELERAFGEAEAEIEGKAKPLNAWKNKFLEKDLKDRPILKIEAGNKKMASMAGVLEKYQAELEREGLFDYDDMILLAIGALEKNDDLRFSLQEKYLYIMLDEYQDTNAAQSRIIELLTNNPASEGRPNVMAVGDDDQAIYAFQGAMSSNLREFYERYRDVKVVNLVKNYRSTADVLYFAKNIAEQIEGRFSDGFNGISKELAAVNKADERAGIARKEFRSSVAESAWVAGKIAELIEAGEDAREIAVVAPKHAYLAELLPFLHEKKVAVTYEKRENILETKVVRELVAIARLILKLASDGRADELWAEVLSYEMWGIDPMAIWRVSWQAEAERKNWAEVLVESDDEKVARAAKLMLGLALRVEAETLEKMIDYIVGASEIEVEGEQLKSPLREFYMGRSDREVYDLLNSLTVLRERLIEYRGGSGGLRDLIQYISDCEAAGIKIINSSPHNEAAAAVNLMTVYGAKGLEFNHVFILSANEATWAKAKNKVNQVNLPINLARIRHVGNSADDKLRLLYVAITRARTNLYVTSSVANFAGKQLARLEYFDERETEDGVRSFTLPEKFAMVEMMDDEGTVGAEVLSVSWFEKHLPTTVRMQDLLKTRLERYRISPTHLNTFTDTIYGGPQKFYENTILRFPQSISSSGVFGNAIHATLDWCQREVLKNKLPSVEGAVEVLRREILAERSLNSEEKERLIERGEFALQRYYEQRAEMLAMKNIRSEMGFSGEMIALGEVVLTGKIDRLEIDDEKKQVVVVDFKTGPSRKKLMKSDPKLHKYLQQVYLYKILVENSVALKGYEVVGARLEFVEPDEDGIVNALEISEFDRAELERCRKLLLAVWGRVMALDFPDIGGYSQDVAGIKRFEDDLLAELER